MSKCPFNHSLRSDLPTLTPRIAALPVDERGYPIPFFVASVDGKPDFRMSDPAKMRRCVREKLCWTCGQPLGKFVTFPIGPMCSISRTTAEPPSHLDCSEWSVKGCPFLSKPQMTRRNHEEVKAQGSVAGEMIERNPGVTALWTCTGFSFFRDGRGGLLIEVGEPESVSWWREGRLATRAEVMESITSGLPRLVKPDSDEEEKSALETARQKALEYLPKT